MEKRSRRSGRGGEGHEGGGGEDDKELWERKNRDQP